LILSSTTPILSFSHDNVLPHANVSNFFINSSSRIDWLPISYKTLRIFYKTLPTTYIRVKAPIADQLRNLTLRYFDLKISISSILKFRYWCFHAIYFNHLPTYTIQNILFIFYTYSILLFSVKYKHVLEYSTYNFHYWFGT